MIAMKQYAKTLKEIVMGNVILLYVPGLLCKEVCTHSLKVLDQSVRSGVIELPP